MTEQATSLAVLSKRHAPESAAVDARNPVMLGKPLIQKRVIGVQQFKHTSVFAEHALEEEFRLLPESLAKIVVEIRINTRIWLKRRKIT